VRSASKSWRFGVAASVETGRKYKSGADFTLTAVLNFVDHGVTGFASGGKDWFPVAGTFEIVA
jgi:hypothetical protein